ncbi:MAG: cobaltochelatase subunit CobT [Gammaproteobacteria bacterium]|nr:cobaltochelatase subunit CobT [Gammaproteobacteria bacterium]
MESEQITDFQDVTAATARVLSEDPELMVRFKPGDLGRADHTVFINRPSNLDMDADIDRIRGQADAAVSWLRYHDDELAVSSEAAEAETQALLEALEKTRCECLGARAFDGVAKNLEAHFHHQYARNPLSGAPGLQPEQLPIALVMFARELLGDLAPPPEAADAFSGWRKVFTAQLEHFQAMAESLREQADFARHARELLTKLGFQGTESDTVETKPEFSLAEVQSNSLSESSGTTGESGDDAVTMAPQGAPREGLPGIPSPGEDAEQHVDHGTEEIQYKAPAGSPAQFPDYRVFTDEFDEIVDASHLYEREELLRLRNQLDDRIGKLGNIVGRLSSRLQRRLLSKQSRGWEFDLDEGELDTSRLSRIVINPLNTLSFKREKEIELRDTVVTCLIDNSGSMRGRPILLAAITADMMARTLERCGVKIEILGFTTRAWKGGCSRSRWLAAGRPSQPGRLNDLRHIIYKSADVPWRRARLGLGLMLREGLLRENIDGEALAWAYARLRARPERRRILIVISDGAPVDDATLSANNGSFLEQHLRQVIAEIEGSGQVELSAIGIGHDVTRYYRRALTLIDADQLSGAVTDELVELLDPTPARYR